MSKKVIKYTIILLIIPILISLIISTINLKRVTTNSSTVFYDENNQIVDMSNDVPSIGMDRGVEIVVISSMFALIIIFVIFYIILSKQKK